MHQAEVYREDSTHCVFLLTLLTQRALDWASVTWDPNPDF